ncbi:hypothetical protein PIB30_033173 [Stylosanthes scabra]|uniref:Uncharacterized protein n=1 Tax=Stylosanthes scabra TaxID=79078 RepID=A0ABU6ZC79_9FABA|nr:hypothetical protein [Stylosanthes scabra]
MRAVLWNPCTGFTFQSQQIRCYANFCGFGYDHLSDTYKFCGIPRKLEPPGFENNARIYTFEPNSSWKRIDDIPIDEDLSRADNQKGTYGHFALPDRDSEHYNPWGYTTLCVLRDCLCVCYGWYERSQQHWILWQMKEYGVAQTWTKLAMIPSYYVCPLKRPYILASDVLLLIIYPGIKVVLYNLNDGSLGDFPVIDQFAD